MIELENVSMTYPGGNQALKNVNINIEKGEFVFIVGSSGSGKTTLFRLLLKELDPTEGNITVAGYDYGKIKRKDIPKVRRRIGVVFQNFRLLKDRTIYEHWSTILTSYWRMSLQETLILRTHWIS